MPYPSYRCRKDRAEFSFDPCDRCGFPGVDTRWWGSRFVDWIRCLRLELQR